MYDANKKLLRQTDLQQYYTKRFATPKTLLVICWGSEIDLGMYGDRTYNEWFQRHSLELQLYHITEQNTWQNCAIIVLTALSIHIISKYQTSIAKLQATNEKKERYYKKTRNYFWFNFKTVLKAKHEFLISMIAYTPLPPP